MLLVETTVRISVLMRYGMRTQSIFTLSSVLASLACNDGPDTPAPTEQAPVTVAPLAAGPPRPTPSAPITRPLQADLGDLVLTDYLDVGNGPNEGAHQYLIDHPTFAGTNDYTWGPAKTAYRETVRGTRTSESFQMKVTPGIDHVLVKAYDALSRDQKMRVFIDSKAFEEDWVLPNSPDRYGEATLTIPARMIGAQHQITIKTEFKGGTIDNNTLAYWMYEKGSPAAQAQK
jgi:hypothetical protein